MSRLLIACAALALAACDGGINNPKYVEASEKAALAYETGRPVAIAAAGGVTLWKFKDRHEGRWVYFTSPSGSAQWTYGCGKGCTRTETVTSLPE